MAHVCEFCGNAQHTTFGCKHKPKGFVHPHKPQPVQETSKGKGKNRKGGGKNRKGGGKADKTKNADGTWAR